MKYMEKIMRNQRKLELTKEKWDVMIASIKLYFLNEREEELGDLSASLILDFVMEKLAPEFYNQGLHDSYRFLTEKCEDMLGLEMSH